MKIPVAFSALKTLLEHVRREFPSITEEEVISMASEIFTDLPIDVIEKVKECVEKHGNITVCTMVASFLVGYAVSQCLATGKCTIIVKEINP